MWVDDVVRLWVEPWSMYKFFIVAELEGQIIGLSHFPHDLKICDSKFPTPLDTIGIHFPVRLWVEPWSMYKFLL